MTLGEAIRARRRALGMKQETLARLIGMPNGQTYISEIERGVRANLTQDVLRRLAAALDMPLSQLIAVAEEGAESATDAPPLDQLRAIGWAEARLQRLADDWPDYSAAERLEIVVTAREMYENHQEAERRRREHEQSLEGLLHRHKPAL